ncbi:PD40 domain-containing protein [Aggregatilinea lenta]|uniref:PD40 domain-containing protein n=1 Tax=Aggregatilinea lenta TaxID=913108 RepID=UPI000E5A2ADC|nr:PD40 domain-containing protein [Aggregatilinea lenta]
MFHKRIAVILLVIALASFTVPGVLAQGDSPSSPVPPGRLVIGDDSGLFTILPDGSDRTPLVEEDDAGCWLRDGLWNPDMTLLAYTRICGGETATDWHGSDRTASIYLYDPDSGDSTELIPNEGSYQDYASSWHPDGNRLAIYSNRGDDGRYDLFVVDTTSGDVTQLTAFDDDTGRATWDPTGRYLLYNRYVAREADSEWEIRVLDTDTDVESPVAVGLTPHWSPDGQWIAYTTEGDVSDVFVLSAACIYDGAPCEADTNARNVTYTPDIAEREPIFSPDQTQIAFLRDADVDPIGFTWDVYRQEIRTGINQNLTGSNAVQERLTSWEPVPDAEMVDVEPLLPVIARVQSSTPANLRGEASVSSARVGTAINGRILFIQGTDETQDWYWVTLPEDGATAWIFGDLITVAVGSTDALPVVNAVATAEPQ